MIGGCWGFVIRPLCVRNGSGGLAGLGHVAGMTGWGLQRVQAPPGSGHR
jgi:hypothetical protein